MQIKMGTGLKLLRGVACHLRSSTLVFHRTDEVTEVQRGRELAQGCTASTFIPEIVRMAKRKESLK